MKKSAKPPKHVLLISKDPFLSMIISRYLHRKGYGDSGLQPMTQYKVSVVRPDPERAPQELAPARKKPWHAVIAESEILNALDAERVPAERRIELVTGKGSPSSRKSGKRRRLIQPISPESLSESLS